MYWVSFAVGVEHDRAVTGGDHRRFERLQTLQRRRGTRPAARTTKTLPSPSTASPVNATSPTTKVRWSGACPGEAITSNGP